MTRFINGVSVSLFGCMVVLALGACSSVDTATKLDEGDQEECGLCTEEGKFDTQGISRRSYIAYGILNVVNQLSEQELVSELGFSHNLARELHRRPRLNLPWLILEELDAVPGVGADEFARLAAYAQANGFVPYCGDGVIQPLLEQCDDGNNADGDGCSSECTLEDVDLEFFENHPDLIRGDLIASTFVNPTNYYLRQRPLETLFEIIEHHLPPSFGARMSFPELNRRVLSRADGILANSPKDSIVTVEELAKLSSSPYVDALYTAERAALAKVWEYFEVNPAQVVTISAVAPEGKYHTEILPPGPLLMSSEPIDALGVGNRDVFQRLLQLPGLNANGDSNTVEWYDVAQGLSEYEDVFTSEEIELLQQMKDRMLFKASPSQPGVMRVRFEDSPIGVPEVNTLAEFDRYQISSRAAYQVYYTVTHSLFNNDASLPPLRVAGEWGKLDVQMTRSLEFGLYANVNDNDEGGLFNHRRLALINLDGTHFSAVRSASGLALMEHWETGGERVYNRLVRFENSFRANDNENERTEILGHRHKYLMSESTSERLDHLAGFRVSGDEGDLFSAFVSANPSDPWWYSGNYQLVATPTYDNGWTAPYDWGFPYFQPRSDRRMPPGRYEALHGVVLDVYADGGVVANVDDCVLPLSFKGDYYESALCEATQQYVRISTTHDGISRLEVHHAAGSENQGWANIASRLHSEQPLNRDTSNMLFE